MAKNGLHQPFYQIKLQTNNIVAESKVDSKFNPNLTVANSSNNSRATSLAKSSNYTASLNKAIYLYDLALRSDPKNPDILTNKGIVLYLLGEQDQSIALYNAALNINPNNVGALFNKAKILNSTGNVTGATFYFKEASMIDPSYKGELINLKSLAIALAESEPAPPNVTHCKESKSVNGQRLC
jgi:tetratricopeptide (TPR) repeat protein